MYGALMALFRVQFSPTQSGGLCVNVCPSGLSRQPTIGRTHPNLLTEWTIFVYQQFVPFQLQISILASYPDIAQEIGRGQNQREASNLPQIGKANWSIKGPR